MAGHGRLGHGRAWQARPWQGMAVTSNIIDYFAKYLILLARITW